MTGVCAALAVAITASNWSGVVLRVAQESRPLAPSLTSRSGTCRLRTPRLMAKPATCRSLVRSMSTTMKQSASSRMVRGSPDGAESPSPMRAWSPGKLRAMAAPASVDATPASSVVRPAPALCNSRATSVVASSQLASRYPDAVRSSGTRTRSRPSFSKVKRPNSHRSPWFGSASQSPSTRMTRPSRTTSSTPQPTPHAEQRDLTRATSSVAPM